MRKCYENVMDVTLLIIMNYYKFISSKYHGIYIYKYIYNFFLKGKKYVVTIDVTLCGQKMGNKVYIFFLKICL